MHSRLAFFLHSDLGRRLDVPRDLVFGEEPLRGVSSGGISSARLTGCEYFGGCPQVGLLHLGLRSAPRNLTFVPLFQSLVHLVLCFPRSFRDEPIHPEPFSLGSEL